MVGIPGEPSAADSLVTRYAQVLDRSGLLAAALRVSQEKAREISPLKNQAGAVYCGELNEAGLSKFAALHPLQHIVERRNLEVRAALSSLNAALPVPTFAGMFPLDSNLSAGRIVRDRTHGALVLIDGHSLSLLAEAVRLFCNFFIAFSHRQIDAMSMQNDFPDEASLRFIPRCMSTTVGHGLVRYATPSSPTSRVTQMSLLVAMLASSTTLDGPSSGVNEAFDRYREANLTLERLEP